MPGGVALLPRLVARAVTGWGSIMDKRLRRAPHAEWVLMCRLGLGQQRIPTLVRVQPAAVGYHLVIAHRQGHWATQSSSDLGGRLDRLRAVIAHAVDTVGGHPGRQNRCRDRLEDPPHVFLVRRVRVQPLSTEGY